ncbi:MAG: 6,7-dimethyl-8-ribityllumazine synthase [Pseudomonadota bacterium]
MKQSPALPAEFQLPGVRIGVIAARFNSAIVDGLLNGALDVLQRHGVRRADIHVVYAPGAFELPLAAQRMAATKRYDALIALGAVIRGATAHFEYVAGPCATGLADVALRQDIPIGFGVLTVDDERQAVERSGPDQHNKGGEAALAVLHMIKLLREISA